MRAATLALPNWAALKGLSLIIAFGAVAVFLFQSPFPLWFKVLFLFSALPMYEFSVVARNYGISMLLMFLIGWTLQPKRSAQIVPALLLALLPQTNVHSLVLTPLLWMAGFWLQCFASPEPAGQRSRLLPALLSALIGGSILWGLHLTLPTADSLFAERANRGLSDLLRAMIHAARAPSARFPDLFGFLPWPANDVFPWLIVAGIWWCPLLALALAGGLISLGGVGQAVYPLHFRHQGIFLCYALLLYWLAKKGHQAREGAGKAWHSWSWGAGMAALASILAVHLGLGCKIVAMDLQEEYSSAQRLAPMITARPDLRSAILIGEPDLFMETLAYYLPHRMFVPRSGEFAVAVPLTRKNRKAYSLAELLTDLNRLQAREKVPLILAIGYPTFMDKPGETFVQYHGRTFTWSSTDKAHLLERTEFLGILQNAFGDENYTVFVFPYPPRPAPSPMPRPSGAPTSPPLTFSLTRKLRGRLTMLNNKKIVVVLPAYNAAKTLEKTVSEIPRPLVDEIILVDDASGDDTVNIGRRLGLKTFVHPHNRGYGGNQKTCYAQALAAGADIVIMLHPDYQYSPRLLTSMAGMIAFGEFDVALGSRILGVGALAGGMPLYKYVANRFLTFVENVFLGYKLSEYHTGYRAFSRIVLETIPLARNSDDFVFDNQLLAQAIWFGFRIGEISCPTRYFAEASSIDFPRSVRYGLGVLYTAPQFRLARWRLLSSALFPQRDG